MKKILVPVDFSEVSRNAVMVAGQIVEITGGEVELLHVVEVPNDGLYDKEGNLVDDQDGNLAVFQRKHTAESDQMKAFVEKLPFAVKHTIRQGFITDEVAHYTHDHAIDLIVVGTKGAKGLREIISGSETQHIVRKATVPVLSVMYMPGGIPGGVGSVPYRNALVVHDFKKPVEQNMGVLREMCKHFNTTIHLFTVREKVSAATEQQIRQNMEAFAQLNKLERVEYHIQLEDDVEEGVRDFAGQHQMDMVCIGTHGRDGLMHWIKGSIAEDLVNHCFRPVMTYRLHEA